MLHTEQIRNNFTFSWADHSYNRERLVVELHCPLEKETMTDISLLAYVLSSATDRYRDIVSLSRYLDTLYGASLYVSASRAGNRMIIHFDVDNVSGLYLTEKDNGIRTAELLCDVITRPYLVDGCFPEETVSVEKEKLREEIAFLINNKEAYCTRMLLREFFRDNVRGLPDLGYIEDIDPINGRDLYDLYRKCLENCNINAFYCGNDLEEVKELVCRTILGSGIGVRPVTFDNSAVALPDSPFSRTEAAGTEQDIFSMIYHCGRRSDSRELAVLKVANSILGGMATSRLFMNVREKKGLCYTCVSNRMTSGGSGIIIESSTSPDKYEANRDSIMEEFAALAASGPTEEELRQAKLGIINSLKGISDTVAGVSAHYFSSMNGTGRYLSPDDEIGLIENVTSSDITSLLSEMRYCGICRLHDDE
ncbi:MAG: insulinase family protein [Oscillospiraceae bacterium]|nr:insulinase family protein [Oscillospiraceae bacterium]